MRTDQQIDCAWMGDQVRDNPRWQFSINDNVLHEIDSLLASLDASDIQWEKTTRQQFAAPALAQLLQRVASELEHGTGMARISGLPVQQYGEIACRRLLFGIAAQLGTPLYQNARGELMGLIADEGKDVGTHRGQLTDTATGQAFLSSRSRAQSTAALRWHTDRCDIVGLLCLSQATHGGVSRLASAVTVSNVMAARRPDLAALLHRDIYRSRLGEETGGEHCYYPLPVFSIHRGKFSSHYSRTFVEAAQKNAAVPRMTDQQWQALDLLSDIADETGFEMVLQPGDLQFLNNHVIYHGRTPFTDSPDPARRRRLLRVWLSANESRELAPGLSVLWGNTAAGSLRGGMCQTPIPAPGLYPSSPLPGERTAPWLVNAHENAANQTS